LHLVNDYRSGQYGFVSSHAANTMACALLFSLIWRKKITTVGMMLWVAANCYSRMYLGVHYPGDILGGLIVGSLVAMGAYWALRRAGLVADPAVRQK
jgi:undecaprenyl-diphosphatase